jgi:hypothetical protein
MDFNVSMRALFFQNARAAPPWMSRILRFHAAMRMSAMQYPGCRSLCMAAVSHSGRFETFTFQRARGD